MEGDPPSSQLDCETGPIFRCVHPEARFEGLHCVGVCREGRGCRHALQVLVEGVPPHAALSVTWDCAGGGFRRAAAHPAPAGLASV